MQLRKACQSRVWLARAPEAEHLAPARPAQELVAAFRVPARRVLVLVAAFRVPVRRVLELVAAFRVPVRRVLARVAAHLDRVPVQVAVRPGRGPPVLESGAVRLDPARPARVPAAAQVVAAPAMAALPLTHQAAAAGARVAAAHRSKPQAARPPAAAVVPGGQVQA